MELNDIPLELLLEILGFAAGFSQACYRSLALVSHQFHSLISLRYVPITLKEFEQLRSFDDFLRTSPHSATQIQYLWIMGDGYMRSSLVESIVKACTGIISLATTTRALVALCSSSTFQHVHLRELTLVENWHPWSGLTKTLHGTLLTAQLTHLCLQESLSPEFPKQDFPRLTHLAFSTRPIREYLSRHLISLEPLSLLQHIVITTFWWRDEAPDAATSDLLRLDQRLEVLHFSRKGWTALEAWEDRARGGGGLWERARRERRSMQILRGARRLFGR